MTATAVGLSRLGRPHARARAGAVALMALGGVGTVAALGLWLAPRALAVASAWLVIAGVVGWALWAGRRARRGAELRVVGRMVERVTEARHGSVVGALPVSTSGGDEAGETGTSAALAALADARAAGIVAAAATRVDRLLARDTRRRLAQGVLAAVAGGVLFLAASPARGRGAFWHPFRALADARAPVRLGVDRVTVHRGDSVTVTIDVPAATRATLWTRGMGEPWRPTAVALDATGRGTRRVGPLQADLYLRATSGTRKSVERKVSVTLPAFIADLDVTARFPAYLQRTDEQLAPGPDTIPLPAGTALVTTGAASVALAAAVWERPAGTAAPARLAVSGTRFRGRFAPTASGTWRLDVSTADGSPVEGEPPELHLRVVPDSAPLVAVPVPGRDTTLPLSLRQPLVIDVRDDHGVTRVEVVSWRVSQTGRVAPAVRQALDVRKGGGDAGDRVLIQGELDAQRRGLLPGDTLRVRVEAWDNAPVPQRGESRELALRLARLEELRAGTRAAARAVSGAVDSLSAAAAGLAQRASDLAQQRPRDSVEVSRRTPGSERGGGPGALPFEASARAAAIARQQAELQQRARELAQAVAQVAQVARLAGLTDTAFQARLAEVEQLLQRALTPELERQLRELQEALGNLDPDATRQALEHLAEVQQQLRQMLERSRELFRRAALEGALQSLAADALDLRREQGAWNQQDAPRPDSAAAGRERALGVRADSLARGIAQAASDLAQTAPADAAAALAAPYAAAQRAHSAMQRAAGAAEARDAGVAASAGAAAESALAVIPDELRTRRDSLTQAWRRETLDALDRALAETAALAERQRRIADALHRGDAGAATRAQQASVEEGTDVIARQIRTAAGRNALVSPQLAGALGFAQRQMRSASQELENAHPSAESAATLADESLDALNAIALTLAKSRSAVAGARSGSGFAEAMEQLAQLARQQGGLNGQAQGLLPLAAAGGEAVLAQLRALAAAQRALADKLDRLRAEGASQAAGALAQEAHDLARQLEAGRLDAQTIQRQERLYRRLLDAGRTLASSEPDEQRERTSRAAAGDSVHLPAPLAPGATGAGPRVRYPTWDELRDLTPDQRRLVLEYFRRLNATSSATPAPAER